MPGWWRWNALYRLAPQMCLGCQPLRLQEWVGGPSFEVLDRQVVEDWGFPSEVLVGKRKLLG